MTTDKLVWGELVHLGYQMWETAWPDLQFDESVWNAMVSRMAEKKLNLLFIALGEGVGKAIGKMN